MNSLPPLDVWEEECARKSIQDFIPFASQAFRPPQHLERLTAEIEAAAGGSARHVVCDAPPRHAKSETILHAIVWLLWNNPTLRVSYSTYGARFARKQSRKAMAIARRMGVQFKSASLDEWVTDAGGGCIWGGVGGPLIGMGVDIAFVDDAFKNRIEAESSLWRERVWDWFRDVLLTRIEGGGIDQRERATSVSEAGSGSVFVFMTRWHPDDLIGRLLNDGGWTHLHFPAISDDNVALWPERWPLQTLERRKESVGLYTWASQYQGEPRPRGGQVFTGVTTYDTLPSSGADAYGLDLSYSAKTSSDFSVAIRLRRTNTGTAQAPVFLYYVVHAEIRQLSAPQFKEVCIELAKESPAATWRWYFAGPEKGSADFFRPGDGSGVNLKELPARADKFTRAIACAAAWNRGHVLVPAKAPWLDRFLSEIAGFTGVNDAHDDVVDALVAAFDELATATPQGVSAEVVQPDRRSEYQALQM